ncbi:MAG TPA: hypothetical protein VE569_12370 [Acidimicrobiia bacterium]|nr:hypothetical protein [Acidimicrobiia bacterium]
MVSTNSSRVCLARSMGSSIYVVGDESTAMLLAYQDRGHGHFGIAFHDPGTGEPVEGK